MARHAHPPSVSIRVHPWCKTLSTTGRSGDDAFDLLMGFVEKHLDDPFYLEGTSSLSLRTIIFRELVANIIAHREYTSAAPATLVIYRDRVELQNPNVPHVHGRIDPVNFTPYPKNPTLCKFMIQLGRYEELGSGVRKVNHYLPHYAPGAGQAIFEDGEMFKVLLPLSAEKAPLTAEDPAQVNAQVGEPDTPQVTPQVIRLLEVLKKEQDRESLQSALHLKARKNFRLLYLNPALESGLIEMTLPSKPNSRLQKYRLTPNGKKLLEARK